MKINKLLLIFIGFFASFSNIYSAKNVADWTLFIYMESDKDLNDAALKNITDIARAGVPENINVVIQLHTWQEVAWRYVLKGNNISLDSIVNLKLEPEDDLTDGFNWAFNNFKSKYKMVVLWNHGFGILDPVWSESDENWVPEISQDIISTRSRLIDHCFDHNNHKGVLFYPQTKVYLTNQAMINAFEKTKNSVLESSKIDIISFDACRMAMIEIGYQLSDFADYLIGSQDCELKDGCDYFSLIKNLSSNKSPKDIAKSIVFDYENYYKPRGACGRYTQSALDLKEINLLVNNLDSLVKEFLKVQNSHDHNLNKVLKEAITNSRKVMPEFCKMPSYIDIYSFYITLKENLFKVNKDSNFDEIIKTLDSGINIIKQIVVASVAGFKSAHSHGISIYYPFEYQECSYAKCMFAQNSLWIKFLKEFANLAF